MASEFQRSLANVLVHEGGKVDHPKDPGGRTNQGVTQRTYDAWCKTDGLTPHDVFSMPDSVRDTIYRAQYWDVIAGDQLPPGVSYVVFDGAVNSGPVQSVMWLQRALGSGYTGKIDGHIGALTMAAVAAHPDHDELVADIISRREAFLKALKTWNDFGRGWSARLRDVRSVGQAWAMGSVGPEVHWVPGGEAKATVTDATKPPARGPADAITGIGIGTGGLSQVIDQAKGVLVPLAGNGGWIDTALGVVTVAGVALAVGGVLYRVWAQRKAADLSDALGTAPA